MGCWTSGDPGVLALPSGRLVRGRALRGGSPGGIRPQFGVYLLAGDPGPFRWPAAWIPWPDLGVPDHRAQALDVLTDAWRRSGVDRVEVACRTGGGRTATALAVLAVIDGLSAPEAIRFVRANHHDSAPATPWQRWFVGSVGREIRRPTSP